MLVGEPGAGAAHPGLYFIKDQQPAVPVAQIPQRFQVTRIRDDDPAFSLYGFKHYRDNPFARVFKLLQGRDIVIGHIPETGQQRVKTGAYLGLAGSAQGRHGPAVKTALHDNNNRFFDLLVASEFPADLDGGFVGFSAGIAEKHTIHSGNAGQPAGQLLLQGNTVQVGRMDQPARLARQHFSDTGMGMTQAADGNPAQGIEVPFPPAVNQPGAFTGLKSHVKTLVSCHYRFRHCRYQGAGIGEQVSGNSIT